MRRFGAARRSTSSCSRHGIVGQHDVAVIVNDMSEVNVDSQLMKNGSTSLSRVDERLVGMQNG